MESSKSSFEGLYQSIKQLDTKDLQMVILFSHLLIMARKKKYTNYRTPAQAMGMFSAGLGGHLEELFKMNLDNGDPLYGALVVNKDNKIPSEGFFDAAIRHNLEVDFLDDSDKQVFWSKQVNKVFESTVSKEIKALLDGLTDSQKRDLELLLRSKSTTSNISVT